MTTEREFPSRATKDFAKKILAPVGLLHPAQSIWYWHLNRVLRRETTKLYCQFISPGDLCFDIGANTGEMAQVMLELGARVIAVEPQRESVDALRKRFARYANFVLVPKAAGAAIGVGKLMVCGRSYCTTLSSEYIEAVIQSGRLSPEVFRWDEVREVPITTLDELIREHGIPVFTKIDVEGFEAEVIKGCSQKLKLLSFEFTPERLQPALECMEMLEKLGPVEFNYCVESERDLRLPGWVSGNEMAHLLKTTRFRVRTAPGGDVYARYTDRP